MIEVTRKVAFLEARDGSRKSVSRGRILDPAKLRRAYEPRASALDVVDVVDTFL